MNEPMEKNPSNVEREVLLRARVLKEGQFRDGKKILEVSVLDARGEVTCWVDVDSVNPQMKSYPCIYCGRYQVWLGPPQKEGEG